MKNTAFEPYLQPPAPALAGLWVNTNPGSYWVSGTPINVQSARVHLTANTTNYVYLDMVNSVIGVNTTGFSGTIYPIAVIGTNGTQTTAMIDVRPDVYRSAFSISTNGTPNPVQGSLNFVAGSNMTITPDAFGNLTFASTGGGGGGGSSPGGQPTNIQYQVNSSTFGGAFNSTYNSTTGESDVANLGQIRYVTAFYNWSRTDSFGSIGNLSTPGSGLTLTIPCSASTPCAGFDTTAQINAPFYVYISGTGTPEAALVTGGTCPSFSTSTCTLVVTTQNSHANGYAVGSATGGIQEAVNEAVNPAVTGPHVTLYLEPAAGTATPNYQVYSTVFFNGNKFTIKGNGALVQCNTRDRCFANSILSGANGIETVFEGIEFVPGINVDGVLISSVKAASGRYTVTTTSAHPFINNGVVVSSACPSFSGDPIDNPCPGLDTVIFHYSNASQTQEARVQVLTGANCVNGSNGGACLNTEFEYIIPSATSFSAAASYGWANIENAALEDIGQHSTMRNIRLLGGSNRFSWGIVVTNDQAVTIDALSTEGSGSVIKCSTSAFCGAMIYGRGDQGAAPLGWVTHGELSMQCGGNGIRWAGGNGLNIKDTVIQSFSQYGLYYGGGLQAWATNNAYEEVSTCANQSYPQGSGAIFASAGYVSGGPTLNIETNTAIASNFPSFPPANVGSQTNNYYIVINSGGASAGMYPIGKSLTTGSGNVVVYWPEPNLDTNSGATVTYDLLKVIGTNPTSMPFGTGNYAVSTGITRGSACTASTGICTFTDTQGALSSYTVATQTITERVTFWPAAVLLSNASTLEMDDCGGAGIVPTTYLPSVVCRGKGSAGASVAGASPVFAKILGASVTTQPMADLTFRGNGAGAGTGGLKGIKDHVDFVGIPQGDLITLQDSNFAKTEASSNYRPSADNADTAIGFDNAQSASASSAQLAFRAPVAISNYVGVQFDNLSWLERLTSGIKLFNTPTVNLQNTIALGGASGYSPFSLVTAPITNCLSGSGGNMTAIQGVINYSGGTATYSSGNPALSACATTTFNASQSIQAFLTTVGAGQVLLSVRGSNVSGNLTRYDFRVLATSWIIDKCNSGGTCSTLNSGSLTFGNGCCFLNLSVTGQATAAITASVYNIITGAVNTFTASDSSSPITSGYPGIGMNAVGALSSATAISQAWQAGADVATTGNWSFNLPVRYIPSLFAALPTCSGGTEGSVYFITDGSTNTQGASVTGGGSNPVGVTCNGINWVVNSGSGGGGGGGSVTSVGQTVNGGSSSGIFSVTGSPVTSTGNLNLVLTGTTGHIPVFTSSTILSNDTSLDDGATAAGTLTYTGAISAAPGGTNVGTIALPGNTTLPSVPANNTVWGGPNTASFTAYGLNLPSAAPSGAQVLQCGTPTASWSTCTWFTAGSAGITNNALTMNNSGSGAASGSAFNGSVAVTASYNTFGAIGGSGLTTGVIPQAASSNTIANTSPQLDNGVSTANTLTYAGTGGFTASAGPIASVGPSGKAGYFNLGGNTANQAVTANTVGFMGPTSATFTAWAVQLPATGPVAGSILQLGAPSSSVSAGSFTTTPSLGSSGTAGTLSLFPASGNFTTTLGSAATASNTVLFPATVPTTLHSVYCVTSSTTCTLTDTGYPYNAIPNADLANSSITVSPGAVTCTLGSSCTVLLSAINPQTATYQVLASDFANHKTITVSAGTFTITLVASGTQPAADQYIWITNYGSGTVTIARSGQTINGGTTSLTLSAGTSTAPQSVRIASDGSNYFTDGIAGGSSGGGTTTNALTMNNSGSGASSGSTFNGASAITLSYNTLGAAPTASPTFTGTVTTPLSTAGLVTTSSGGVLSSEANATVAQGGTGNTSTTAYAPILGGTTTTGAFQAAVVGTSGQVFVSQGSATKPTYIDFPERFYIPAANCNNTTPGVGWSIGSGGTAVCRAGTNNLGGAIQITDTSSTFAQFTVMIPEDWDTGTNPYIRFYVSAVTDTTNGHTIIPQIKVSCPTAANGTTSDDATFSAAQSSSTITLGASAVANGFYNGSNVQIGSTQMTGCIAGGMMIVQVGRATDTATGNVNFWGAGLTFPRQIVVQAN